MRKFVWISFNFLYSILSLNKMTDKYDFFFATSFLFEWIHMKTYILMMK